MYLRYFGLQEEPFSIAPNPSYLYMSDRHREALAHLLYGVGVGGGFVLLTGEVGTGKTTISRCLLQQLPENTDIAYILNPFLSATELLATICDELGIDTGDDKDSLKNLTDCLYHFLLENHSKGRNTVLLIDEAQHLQFEVLEQIRLLTNLETNTKKLLQIIFVGQPELQALLEKPVLRQLAQRITARCHINPLNYNETREYIRHRLHIAGLPANQELFSSSIVKEIHKKSGGIPRLINVLCDRTLLGTYAQNKSHIDQATLKQAAIEVMGSENGMHRGSRQPSSSASWLPSLAVGILLIAGVALAWWQWPTLLAEFRQAPLATSENAPGQPAGPEPALAQATKTASTAQGNTSSEQAVAEILTADKFSPQNPSAARLPEQQETGVIATPAWFGNQNDAINEILRHAKLVISGAREPCLQLTKIGLRCEFKSAENWQELRQFNRSAVLELGSPDKQITYAPLISMNDTFALISINGQTRQLALTELGELWNGNFIFFWQPPADFERPVALGDRARIVAWVALKFAEIDQQPQALSGEKFSPELFERIKLFQRENNLADDGIIGMKTLLKLNEKLGLAKTTLDELYIAQSSPITKG
jgi:general secretion pathway protein A